MKTTEKKVIYIIRCMGLLFVALMMSITAVAQNSAPRPGSGSSAPRPGSGSVLGPNGIGWNPGPVMGSRPPMVRPIRPLRPAVVPSIWTDPFGGASISIGVTSPGWENNGIMNIMCCGYDAQDVWQEMPLRISYNWNGVNYNVTVLNAWNPWTGMWNVGVDMPAYATDYFINGQTYNYYVPLSTGTYYFNL